MRIQFNTKLTRYGISGVTSTTVNLTLTWVLDRLSMNYMAAVTLAFMCSVVVSFALQKFFTFANRSLSRTHSQFALFLVFAGVNLVVNDGLVYVQYDLLQFKRIVINQAIASAIIAFYSYFVYRYMFGGNTRLQVASAADERS